MVIGVIKDSDLRIGLQDKPLVNPTVRYAARGILLNGKGEVAIVYKANKNEYKLPGGGIENEDPTLAFKREVSEETGCDIEIIDNLGTIEEHKSKTNFKQISYVFVGRVIKETGKLNLTEKEKIEGTRFLWTDLDNAIKLVHDSFDKLKASSYKVKDGYESVYMTQFVIKRDEQILKYYKNYCNYKSK